MSSPEKVLHPRVLKSLSKTDLAQLKKELRGHLKASPATGKLIKAHAAANKTLRKKLTSTVNALKAKKRSRAK